MLTTTYTSGRWTKQIPKYTLLSVRGVFRVNTVNVIFIAASLSKEVITLICLVHASECAFVTAPSFLIYFFFWLTGATLLSLMCT